MKQNQSISKLLFLLMVMMFSNASSQTPGSPSVLLITVDNLRPDHMSVYGYEKETTPNLKKFAAESVVFERAFSTSAWTAPGMVSIFTGYYPPVHAQHGRFSFYDDEMASALRVLAAHGYEILGEGISGPSHQGFGFQKRLGQRPQRLESFIEDRIDNPKPFFAWAHIKDVHLPYAPSPANTELFNANDRQSPAIEAVKKHRIILRHPERVDIEFTHAGKVRFEPEDIDAVRALYDAEVADADARLGRALKRMAETGLLDRTIVIVSADHGEELFDHGWLGHASTGYDAKLYDELIRIPLMIRLPDSSLRGRYDAMVQGVDFMPTLFELLGIDAGQVEPAMQGRSFVPVIKGEAEKIRDYVFGQTSLKGWTTPRDEMKARIHSVRSADKKLIRIPDSGGMRIEAFDLDRDPGELENVYQQRAGDFSHLETTLDKWIDDNRSLAASLVIEGAERRIAKIADALLLDADLNRAILSWSAIQTMEQTWGLEPYPFYNVEPYATRWQGVQRTAAALIGLAMTCRSRDGKLITAQPERPMAVEDWVCETEGIK